MTHRPGGGELLNFLSTYYTPGAGYEGLYRMFHLNITRMLLEVVVIIPISQEEAAEWIRTQASLILKPVFPSLYRHTIDNGQVATKIQLNNDSRDKANNVRLQSESPWQLLPMEISILY